MLFLELLHSLRAIPTLKLRAFCTFQINLNIVSGYICLSKQRLPGLFFSVVMFI